MSISLSLDMEMDSVTMTGVTAVESLSHLFNLPLHVL